MKRLLLYANDYYGRAIIYIIIIKNIIKKTSYVKYLAEKKDLFIYYKDAGKKKKKIQILKKKPYAGSGDIMPQKKR